MAAIQVRLAFGAALLFTSANVYAQTSPIDPATADASADNDDIIVTASKTGATKLQNTPLAVTAFTAETMEKTGVKDIRDLAAVTPNMLITQNQAFSQVYIRGIGSNNVFGGSDPSSTIHLDGVYLARPASYLSNFLDVERIEVLRGPQGTLYGRNSVGGTINVISRKPGNDFEGKVQATYGNYNFARLEAYFGGPVVEDKIAASFAIIGSRRDGYLENIVPGVGDADDEKTVGFRGQLRFTPSAPLEIILRGDNVYSSDALAGYIKTLQPTADPLSNSIITDFRKIALDLRPSAKRRQWGAAMEVNYDLATAASLKSLTSYRANELTSVSDSDGTAIRNRRTDIFEDQHQFSQEFNLTGAFGGLTYILGAYYFNERIDVDSTVTTFGGTAANFSPVINTDAYAAFAQGSYAMTDWLTVTAGIRYTEEHKKMDQVALFASDVTGLPLAGYPLTYSVEDTYKAWTPKFGIELRPADGVLLYASATKGFKSGGFNFSSRNPNQGFDPEMLWSYEAGAKFDLFGRLMRINATVFHYDYTDLQVQSFLSPGVIDITNASDAKVDGVELETQIRPTQWFRFGGNLAYLDARYDNYTSALLAGNIPYDASGNRLSLSPEWSYSVFAEAEAPIGDGSGFIRGEYNHRTRQFFTAENAGIDSLTGDAEEAYGLVNASAGYTFPGDSFQLIFFGRNLTDREYMTSTATSAGRARVGRVGEPRTYGIRGVVKF
ncbi:TonB-dependent receptor [Croceicoccus ponticola]|uniref:TonB-dependent receptor n=1 Tax=Croceicoccus ponticola TaxID=2217664 RepID=A0A437GZJ0_9SPHN|nr:TonB-dependent receptor [Croceicoccus ponticola]RVQ68787.1 TonB-dependent receptor [Croceicoccus ponticola]